MYIFTLRHLIIHIYTQIRVVFPPCVLIVIIMCTELTDAVKRFRLELEDMDKLKMLKNIRGYIYKEEIGSSSTKTAGNKNVGGVKDR